MPQTPEHYQHELTLQGGLNPFGEPRFILHWGENPIIRTGMPDCLLAPWLDCWVLAEWRPPLDFGLPTTWDGEDVGPYPSRGAYMIMQVFRYGQTPAMLDTAPLNINVLRRMVHYIKTHQGDSMATRMLNVMDIEERRQAEQREKIADCLEDAVPKFGDTASFSRQQNCNTSLKQRMDKIERHLPYADLLRRQLPKRLSISHTGAR